MPSRNEAVYVVDHLPKHTRTSTHTAIHRENGSQRQVQDERQTHADKHTCTAEARCPRLIGIAPREAIIHPSTGTPSSSSWKTPAASPPDGDTTPTKKQRHNTCDGDNYKRTRVVYLGRFGTGSSTTPLAARHCERSKPPFAVGAARGVTSGSAIPLHEPTREDLPSATPPFPSSSRRCFAAPPQAVAHTRATCARNRR